MKCPNCNSTQVLKDTNRGEIYCQHCGLVIDEDMIDLGPEWRAFDHEQKTKRARGGSRNTNTVHDNLMTTQISPTNKDCFGRTLSPNKKQEMWRLRNTEKKNRILNNRERNLAFALTELNKFSSLLQIPHNIREDGAAIYRKAVKKNLIRGRSIEGVVAASLYTACRQCKVPRTLDEIAEVSRVSKKEVGRTYRILTRELGIKLAPTSPVDYIPRFASELGLCKNTEANAIKLINIAKDRSNQCGQNPTATAGAALYAMCAVMNNENITQKDVAQISGCSELTLRKRYKFLSKLVNISIEINN